MKITLSRTAHAQSITYKCVSLSTSRIVGACIEMADLFAVVFEIRRNKNFENGGRGGRGRNP